MSRSGDGFGQGFFFVGVENIPLNLLAAIFAVSIAL
jgi:hypothetical protein